MSHCSSYWSLNITNVYQIKEHVSTFQHDQSRPENAQVQLRAEQRGEVRGDDHVRREGNL